MALVSECGFNGLGHFVLPGAVLEGERGSGKQAGGGEEVVQGREGGAGRGRDGWGGGHCFDDMRRIGEDYTAANMQKVNRTSYSFERGESKRSVFGFTAGLKPR